MKRLGTLVLAVALCSLYANTTFAQQTEGGGSGPQIPDNWEDPAQELPSETQVPAEEDTLYGDPSATQEAVLPSETTGVTEQDSMLPAEPTEDIIPSDPALDPRQAPGETVPMTPEDGQLPPDHQETQIPGDPGAMDPEAMPPGSEGAPVLVIPVQPDGESGEEGAGETQLLIIPIEPSEEQTLPQDEPQAPPAQPVPENEEPVEEPEQVYIE